MKQEIIIVNPEIFEETKKNISKGGTESIHIVSDFDKTLTKLFLPKKGKVNSLISILRNGNYLDEDYVKKAHELFLIYHPIEINSNIDPSKRKKKMKEWWEKHFTLLAEKGLDRNLIINCAKDMKREKLIVMREGVREFIKILDMNDIPLLIISSSIGDLIREFMKLEGLITEDTFIISNEFDYGADGRFKGVKKIVHILNKDESSVRNFPEVHKRVEKRKNVVLLGDGIGDIDMIHGFDHDNLIKIGFLNEEIENNIEKYKENFDVILTGDQDFSFVNKLVKEMFDIK